MDVSMFQSKDVTSERVLYTATPFAMSNLFYLQETGMLRAQKNHTSKRDGLKSFLFFIVLSGKGKITFDGDEYNVQSGDCVFIDCSKSYSHQSLDNKWSLRWVHFYSDTMNAIYRKFTERGGRCCFKSVNFMMYDRLLHDIYAIATSDNAVRDMKINEKLSSILAYIMEDCFSQTTGEGGTASARRDLSDIREYLREHYTEKITLEELSQRFFLNKFYLARCFKEQFGTTVIAYITELRITQAKQLLRFTDIPIERIAYEVGITDANYFSRIFHKAEGISPGDFRRKWTKGKK